MASKRSDTGPGNTAGDRNNSRIVIVNHAPTEAAAAIDGILALCDATSCRVSPGSRIERRSDECGIALVLAAGPPEPRAPVLDDLRRLKTDGFTVLCCASDAHAW